MDMQIPLTTPRINLARGYPLALTSAGILATTAIFIRHLTQTYQIPALVLATWRDAFVAITLALLLRLVRPSLLKAGRQHIQYLLVYGLILAVFNSLWTQSVVLNGAAVSTVLAYCSAGFTALLGRWFLKERLDAIKLMAVAFSLVGSVLVANALDPKAWSSNTVGILVGILSGLCYAFYSLMGRSAAQRGLNTWTTILYTFGFAALFLVFFNLFPGEIFPGSASHPADFFWLSKAWEGWSILFLLAAGPTLVGFGLYNMSLIYLPSSVANIILTLEPVFTIILAYLLFGEILSVLQIVGGVLIVSGVIFLRWHESRAAYSPVLAEQG
jgi:drug/metabolite transporter (DMT)-like permease